MQPFLTRCLLLVLGLSLVAARSEGQDKPPTPAEQFKAIRKEYDKPPGPFPKSDAERLKWVHDIYRHHFTVAPKFLELAEKHPNDPIALEALTQAVWQVNTTPWPVEVVGHDTARPKAFELIMRDHIKSDKLVPLCQRVSIGFCQEYETFLRAALAKNPNKNVQAHASLALGHYLNTRLNRVELCRQRPEAAKEFADLYGREYIAELMKQDPDKAAKEVEAAFEDAAKKYGDVLLSQGDTIAERVEAELFEIRHLSVGKEAPDIAGEDQDGKQFKLSEYRGKVVLLDFWSYV